MSRKTEVLVSEDGLTRRAFLVRAAGVGAVLVAAGSMSGVLAACSKATPTADFSVGSTTPDPTNHSHDVKILGADVDSPTDKTYTSDGATHQHTVALTKADFENIKKGQEVTIVSGPAGGTPHTHTFKIKKPA